MSQRHRVQGNRIILATTVTLNREPFFGDPAVAQEAVETLYRVRTLHPFSLYGFVIMPDHCHILMMNRPPQKISTIIATFKSGMTFNTGIPQMWQHRFDMRIVKHHPNMVLNYIHMNPVEAGLAEFSHAYPWSSASDKWVVDPFPESITSLLPPSKYRDCA